MRLYRFISFETFVDIIQKKALAFVRPELWEDPCESYLLKALRTEHGRREIKDVLKGENNHDDFLAAIGKQYYGQCWTKINESDAFWRIYSYDNKSIRIAIDVEDLGKLRYENIGVVHRPVCYTNNISLKSEVDRVFKQGKIHAINAFLTKREAFKHEKEYRIIVFNPIENSGDVIYLSFDEIDGFIKSVMLHPQAPNWFDSTVEEYCRINGIKYVGKSKLYDKVF